MTETTDKNRAATAEQWTSLQAYVLAVICLLAGIASGWFVRGSQSPVAASAPAASAPSPAGGEGNSGAAPTPAQLLQMADAQAAPLIEKSKANPSDASLLQSIGNIYYDAQQFPAAIEYYRRALQIKPEDASVRTDMATAYWYTGNADMAIEEFQKSLAYEPNKANTLFNLGVVQWQGKMDIDRAVATWQKLLDTNPDYPARDKVRELMAEAKKHSGVPPGTPAKPL